VTQHVYGGQLGPVTGVLTIDSNNPSGAVSGPVSENKSWSCKASGGSATDTGSLSWTGTIAAVPPPCVADEQLLREIASRTDDRSTFIQHMKAVDNAYRQFVISLRAKGGKTADILAAITAHNPQYEADLRAAYQADRNFIDLTEHDWLARAQCPTTPATIRTATDDIRNYTDLKKDTYSEAPELAARAVRDNCGCGGFGLHSTTQHN
jgi:hypothetical protein